MEWENGEGGKGGANVNKRIKNLADNKNRVVDYWAFGTKERQHYSKSFFHTCIVWAQHWMEELKVQNSRVWLSSEAQKGLLALAGERLMTCPSDCACAVAGRGKLKEGMSVTNSSLLSYKSPALLTTANSAHRLR